MTDDLEFDAPAVPANTNHPHSRAPYLLTLTSFSHRHGPLVPPPTPGLLFDVRALPNAPKRLRDMCVGTDKALRTAVMAEGRWKERVREIEGCVRGVLRASQVAVSESGTEVGGEKEESEEDEEDGEGEEPIVHVRVGVCCEMGRHRSVACVEELARITWPQGWDVEVVHRDLKRQRSERDKEKRSRKVARVDESD